MGGSGAAAPPIGSMSLRPGIPRRVALQQRPPPLPRPNAVCNTAARSATILQGMIPCPDLRCLSAGGRFTGLRTFWAESYRAIRARTACGLRWICSALERCRRFAGSLHSAAKIVPLDRLKQELHVCSVTTGKHRRCEKVAGRRQNRFQSGQGGGFGAVVKSNIDYVETAFTEKRFGCLRVELPCVIWHGASQPQPVSGQAGCQESVVPRFDRVDIGKTHETVTVRFNDSSNLEKEGYRVGLMLENINDRHQIITIALHGRGL